VRDGGFAGATQDRAVGHRFARERALHVAVRHAHPSRGLGWQIVLPRRPAPKRGGAGFAGVRTLVLRREIRGKSSGMLMLTT
jgi:hypothetical protein